MEVEQQQPQKPSEEVILNTVKRLQQQFGRNLDKSVLEAVLELNNYDYNQAEGFLRAENQNAGYDLQNFNPANAQQEAIPADYFEKPENFMEFEVKEVVTDLDKLKELFLKQSTFQEHYIAQRDDMTRYLSTLVVLIELGMEVKDSSKARALAALWSHKKYKIADFLLEKRESFGLTEVLKAVNLLDSNRKIRVLEKRLNLLQRQKNVKAKTTGKVNSSINDLKREPVTGTLSGSITKHIKKWVKTITKEELQFYAIQLPKEPWKELADVLHLNPKKDFAEPWFLELAFGAAPPEDSIVYACANLSKENVNDVVKKFNVSYSFLRKNQEVQTPEAIAHVALSTPLETLLWWYEEIKSDAIDLIIKEKIASQVEPIKLGYGKLMERLLTLRDLQVPFYQELIPLAEKKLGELSIPLEPPVVCIGDASYSMDVAIRVSTIIASLMAALTNADLRFFNSESITPAKIPKTIQDVMELTMTMKADKMTCPASALKEYYDQKIPIKTFIMVTDEVENEKYQGDYFAQLFYKYKRDVEPLAQIVFVSFLSVQNTKGRMVRSLEGLGIKPFAEVTLDGRRPDLTKLDSLLVLLAAQSSVFPSIVENNIPKVQHLLQESK